MTSDIGGLDNRLRETEDAEDVDQLGCAGQSKWKWTSTKKIGVPIKLLQRSRRSGNSSKNSLSVILFSWLGDGW